MDRVISLSVAYQRVCKYIPPEMEFKVDMILEKLIPVYTKYELLEK